MVFGTIVGLLITSAVSSSVSTKAQELANQFQDEMLSSYFRLQRESRQYRTNTATMPGVLREYDTRLICRIFCQESIEGRPLNSGVGPPRSISAYRRSAVSSVSDPTHECESDIRGRADSIRRAGQPLQNASAQTNLASSHVTATLATLGLLPSRPDGCSACASGGSSRRQSRQWPTRRAWRRRMRWRPLSCRLVRRHADSTIRARMCVLPVCVIAPPATRSRRSSSRMGPGRGRT